MFGMPGQSLEKARLHLLLRLGFSLTEMSNPKSWLIARGQHIVLETVLISVLTVVYHREVSGSPVGAARDLMHHSLRLEEGFLEPSQVVLHVASDFLFV